MDKLNSKDVLIVGVGGQGTLLASRILGNLAQSLGYDVKLSEVHGMAQRGGSVVTHVRFGEKVYAPTIDEAGADIIIAFEKLEAYRWIGKLKKDGKMFVNTQEIAPMPVITGKMKYPDDIEESNQTECAGCGVRGCALNGERGWQRKSCQHCAYRRFGSQYGY